MDAPSSFFFNLEQKVKEKKTMLYLKDVNGNVISDLKEMRKIASEFIWIYLEKDNVTLNALRSYIKTY